MNKGWKITLLVIGLLILTAAIGVVAWGNTPAKPMAEALHALQPDPRVSVSQGEWLAFSPAEAQTTTGLIIYPGARVDYRSYAPATHLIASHGFLVIIIKMPLNLAVLDANAADDVIAAYPDIQHWVVGGHSLGGAMAASYANNHPDTVKGLVLWAAYPASNIDFSGNALAVASIYGTLDGLTTGGEIDTSRALLPADTMWIPIEGGNHAQFGWYGDQAGDNSATISRQQQQEQVVTSTVMLLESIK